MDPVQQPAGRGEDDMLQNDKDLWERLSVDSWAVHRDVHKKFGEV